jgi:hypothetical protein
MEIYNFLRTNENRVVNGTHRDKVGNGTHKSEI